MMSQEAALAEIANSRLRRLSAHNKSFSYTDVKVGDTALLYEAMNKKSMPRFWTLTRRA